MASARARAAEQPVTHRIVSSNRSTREPHSTQYSLYKQVQCLDLVGQPGLAWIARELQLLAAAPPSIARPPSR